MKIGIFSETYRPTINGVVVSIDTFKEQFEHQGHKVTIFAPFNRHQKTAEAGVYRFPSIHFPRDPIYPLALPVPLSLAKQELPIDLIAELDIIHVQHFAMMGQYGLSLGRQFKIPTVYTYHTMAELYTSYLPLVGNVFDPTIRTWTRWTAARSNHLVTPTQSVKSYLRGLGIKKPISVIPTGIHTRLYHRTSRIGLEKKYRIPAHRDILLSVGRLSDEKNIRFLLEAFRQVQLARPDTQLLLVGGGPDKHRYERLVRHWGLNQFITLTGFLPRPETIDLFGVADLFVFPSITDTQGIVILEAMAAGSVPVAIDRLGPRDIIKDGLTGRLTELNLAAFSGSILELLHDKAKRHRLSIAARHQVKRYDATLTGRAMEKLYYEEIRHYSRSRSHPAS